MPDPHVLQTWTWGDCKSDWGWTAERLLWLELDTPVAAAQILRRLIPHTPWSFLYAPKGPALDYANDTLTNQVLGDLERYAKQTRALFIKIDPDVPLQYGEPQAGQPFELGGQAMLDMLAQRGWHFSPEQIQFRNTVIVDLTLEPDDLLAALKSKWRYNIRLAERKGVAIRQGNSDDISTFYRMYAHTAARDGFLIRPQAYYRQIWQRFLAAGQAEMLLAAVEDEVVAGLILFIFGQTAWYMYGASTEQHRQLMPNHLLQWAAMRRAKERGCARYDLWGAPDVFNKADGMWGVYRFKQGFGGQVVQGLGAFDYPANRPLYWAFTVVLPRLRSLLRRLKRY
ncbi:MAG: peptidoglycan bridge formation glycyltransferase FemA/FemB family protein [Anaerolineae bacterium]|nr:peptidoglycan bridge formation glycyltransferase FemA/FemB family protein [Anaerolineae bacterium]